MFSALICLSQLHLSCRVSVVLITSIGKRSCIGDSGIMDEERAEKTGLLLGIELRISDWKSSALITGSLRIYVTSYNYIINPLSMAPSLM